MPSYYVQKFTYDGPGESTCYGEMDAHNHDHSNQFTVDVKNYLQGLGLKNVEGGPFRSNQPEPAQGKEFHWDDKQKLWVKS